jgi:UDP-2,3-diacylglucosamine hydrolase
VVDFISDLHLQAAEPQTFAAWKSYLENTKADAVFILGDLFEVWVGDDAVADAAPGQTSFLNECAGVLKQTTERLSLYFMRGNRDFLVGQSFCASSDVALLADPCVLEFGAERWVLSHGDALCLADADYQQFRKIVRSAEWQANFLAKPLYERHGIARGLREQSQAKNIAVTTYADADEGATLALLAAARATQLVHGHTHRPASHTLPGGFQRHVLSDWDLAATPARAQVFRLALGQDGATRVSRIAPGQA